MTSESHTLGNICDTKGLFHWRSHSAVIRGYNCAVCGTTNWSHGRGKLWTCATQRPIPGRSIGWWMKRVGEARPCFANFSWRTMRHLSVGRRRGLLCCLATQPSLCDCKLLSRYQDIMSAYDPAVYSNVVVLHYVRANSDHFCYAALESFKVNLLCCSKAFIHEFIHLHCLQDGHCFRCVSHGE